MLTEQDWLKIFMDDIAWCESKHVLRKWGVMFASDIKQQCPNCVGEIRKAYEARMRELK